MIDYNVQLIQFPNKKVKETIVKNEDDSYTIFIDSSLSSEEQRNAFKHAMKHIMGNDFDKEDADNIEYNAHNMEVAMELCVWGYYE